MQAKVLYMSGNESDSKREVPSAAARPKSSTTIPVPRECAFAPIKPPRPQSPPRSPGRADSADAQAQVAGDGVGCHAGANELRRAAEAAGQSELLQRLATDYPTGPT
jgi:hypothetical protein